MDEEVLKRKREDVTALSYYNLREKYDEAKDKLKKLSIVAANSNPPGDDDSDEDGKDKTAIDVLALDEITENLEKEDFQRRLIHSRK